jgi:hypothetical protein
MASFDIDFQWQVADAYEAVPPKAGQTSTKPKTLIEEVAGRGSWRFEASGSTKSIRPLQRGDLYLSVMKMKMTPQEVLHLIQQVGFLEEDKNQRGESFDRWTELQEALQELERLSHRSKRLPPVQLGVVRAVLKNGASANAIISFQPRDLRTAIILQCTQALISGCVIRACEGCGKWFEAGGHSGRRADATFHDEACRTRTKNLRHSGKRRGAVKPSLSEKD